MYNGGFLKRVDGEEFDYTPEGREEMIERAKQLVSQGKIVDMYYKDGYLSFYGITVYELCSFEHLNYDP